MKKNQLFLFFFLLLAGTTVQAQQTTVKVYRTIVNAGDATLGYDYGEYNGSNSSRIYAVQVPVKEKYILAILVNMKKADKLQVYIDDSYVGNLYGTRDGWQTLAFSTQPFVLTADKHILRFVNDNNMVPMVDEIKLVRYTSGRNEAASFGDFADRMQALRNQAPVRMPTVAEAGDLTNKVLPNPKGLYDHAIDTTFSYSHFSWVYLTAGSHTFTTVNSTAGRSLTVFNPANYTYSWSNVNGGANGESYVIASVPTSAYYAVMLRPYTVSSGTTDIYLNGSLLVPGATIGGRTYANAALRGGDLNYFTCRLTGGDTRMMASRYFASSARGYNDDYTGGGNWNWGLASRIKKTFTGVDSVQYAFVCAYSPNSNGISDVYLGCENSNLHQLEPQNFPLLTDDDAIRSAPSDGIYNCISWSGGITSTWIWPPYMLSTYNCTNANLLQCFDNFYSNTPVRYPGAWNYTRTGATEANSVVDLWKTATAYTHASVKKPGNNHPHGYDWESKPGGTNRTFHPRYALEQANWYGFVTNYYKPTGTYARNGGDQYSFETDADAVKAGVAIFDKAHLSDAASEKLNTLLRKNSASARGSFEELYNAWDATKVANASLSDPSAYCRNTEYKALETWALKNPRQAMLLVFDKYIHKNDLFIGDLMVTLTRAKYIHLLDQVKAERLAKPYDEQGRYRIHGDYDNGVLYVEKILAQLQEEPEVVPVTDQVNVVVSPNPVRDRLTVQLTLAKGARVSVQAISGQTRQTRVLQTETTLAAGSHRFNMDITGFAGTTGDIIAVQVMVDGQLKTVKVLVTK